MSIFLSLESTVAQATEARRAEADRVRLVRSLRHRSARTPRHSLATALRGWADRLEPETPCLDC